MAKRGKPLFLLRAAMASAKIPGISAGPALWGAVACRKLGIFDAGKVVPVIPRRHADHRPCRGGARRADRQPGRSCRSSRATARNGRGGARGFRHAHHRRWEGRARRAAVPIDGGKVVPIIQGHGLASWCRAGSPSCRHAHHRRREGRAAVPIIDLAAVVPVVSSDSRKADARRAAPPCPSSRATARNGRGGVRPQLRTMRRRADRRRPVSGKVVPIDGGKVMPVMPCRSSTLPRWCPSCRLSTAGKVVPVVPRCRSTAARSCPSCRAAVSIIQGHGLASWCRAGPPSCRRADRRREGRARRAVPPCRSTAGKLVPIDGGNVVPVMPRRRAHHPGPRPGKLVPRRFPVVPSCRSTPARSCRAAVSIIDLAAVVPVVPPCQSTAGSWCPSSRATARNGRGGARPQLRTMAPPCRSTPAGVREGRADRRREGNARRAVPSCRSSRATAWQRPRWCPWFPSCPSSTAGSWCPPCRGADRQPGRSCPSCRAAVPIIQGHGLAMAAVVPVVSVMPIIDGGKVVPCRRVDRRRKAGARRAAVPIDSREGRARRAAPPCRSSRATAWQAGAAPVPRRTAVPIDGGKLVPIIQGHGSQRPRWCPSAIANNAPPCRSTPAGIREGRARHAAPPCRSSRATAWQAGAAPVPRRAHHRRREGGARRAAPPCRSSRATARNGRGGARRADHRQPGRWCPSCRGADRRREGRADRRREAGARHAAPRCRSSTLPRWCPSCRSTAGKLVPIIQGHGLASWCRAGPPSCPSSTAGRWCPSCRAAVPIIQGHGLATAAVVPVVSVMPIIDGGKVVPVVPRCRSTAGRSCPSSTAGRLYRAAVPIDAGRCPGRSCRSTAGSWCPSCRAAVPIIDLAAVVPVVPIDSREAGADRRGEGRAVPPCRSSTLPRWCPSCRSTAGSWCPLCRATVPIIQGHGSQWPGWCPSCRSSTAGKVVVANV